MERLAPYVAWAADLHRSGIDSRSPRAIPRETRVLNARRHRSGIERAQRSRAHGAATVLNARRHRSGIELPHGLQSQWWPSRACSTPEGIEAGSSCTRAAPSCGPSGAQRPKASKRDRELLAVALGLDKREVLNARRHRSGIECGVSPVMQPASKCSTPEGIEAGSSPVAGNVAAADPLCSTPEGIEAGSSTPAAAFRARPPCAQRPKASKRDRGRKRSNRRRWGSAQRPKASKRDRDLDAAAAFVLVDRCSTPEGIEAGSRDRPRFGRGRPPGAQRPKASKRDRGGSGDPRNRHSDVLNARRHRSGIEI